MKSSEFEPFGLYLKEVTEIPRLSDDEKKVIFDRVAEGDEEARSRLIEANLRLVIMWVNHYAKRWTKQYGNTPLDITDLIQSGNEGLIRAVDKFDSKKGCEFSTYATCWIRQSITRALSNQSRTIRIPVHMVERADKLDRIQKELSSGQNCELTDDEIIKYWGSKYREKMSKRLLDDVRRFKDLTVISFNGLISPDSDTEYFGVLPSGSGEYIDMVASYEDINTVEDIVMDREFMENLNEFLESLPNDRYRKVFIMRCGLDGKGIRTLKKIGEELGISKQYAGVMAERIIEMILKYSDETELIEPELAKKYVKRHDEKRAKWKVNY